MKKNPPHQEVVSDSPASCFEAARPGTAGEGLFPTAVNKQFLEPQGVDNPNLVQNPAVQDAAAAAVSRDKPRLPSPENLTPEEATAARALRDSQRLISIGRMSAEIVHEINNPLESVGNLLYLALHEPGVPESALAFLRSAENELQRVVQISKQTLSFSRESAVPVSVHPVDLMDEVIGMYSRRINQKQLKLIQEYAPTDGITAVPGEIRQVFSNLITNAIEASTKSGTLRLRVRNARCHGKESRRGVRITVCDNGSGIEESALRRLGEIFFTTKGESGTGLGLWVTKAIVSRYGGSMRIRSATGEIHGTVFTIFLPVIPANAKTATDSEVVRRTSGNVTEISRHPRHATHLHLGPGGAKGMQREG